MISSKSGFVRIFTVSLCFVFIHFFVVALSFACPHGFKLGPNNNGVECSEINQEIVAALNSEKRAKMPKYELTFVDNDGDLVMSATVERVEGESWYPSGTYNICDVAEFGVDALLQSSGNAASPEKPYGGPILRKMVSLEFIVQQAREGALGNPSCIPSWQSIVSLPDFYSGSALSSSDPLTQGISAKSAAGPCAVAVAPACDGSCPAGKACVSVATNGDYCTCPHSQGSCPPSADQCPTTTICHTETIMTPQCHVVVNHKCKVVTPPAEACECSDPT